MNRSRRTATASRHAIALAVIVVPALLLSGCGSGDSGADPGQLTKPEFIEKANAICNRANDELRVAMAATFGADQKPDDETGIRFTHETWVPNLREQTRMLRELDPPTADRDLVEAMLKALETATDRVEADPALASEGPFDQVTRRLTAYGIGPCGSP